MRFRVTPSSLQGEIRIPGSKSHTIRAVAITSFAQGRSIIHYPLDSGDTQAVVRVYSQMGAEIQLSPEQWTVKGIHPEAIPSGLELDTANSGTTFYIALAALSLASPSTNNILTGDSQIQRRPCQPLIQSLNDLGAYVSSIRGNGCAPVQVRGQLRGGKTTISCPTSQYLTALLLALPLAKEEAQIHVPLLYEHPYVQMTLDWLNRQHIQLDYLPDFSYFRTIPVQRYSPMEVNIPADFSTAAFFLAAGALPGNQVICQGLDFQDSQADKKMVDFLSQMGARVSITNQSIRVQGQDLHGGEFDLNSCPDLLPMLSALAIFADTPTKIYNVPQARIKETDRIAVMHQELEKTGARIEEFHDGMIIYPPHRPQSAEFSSHHDHRIAMALTIIATQLKGDSWIHHAEACQVTVPTFPEMVKILGGQLDFFDDPN